MRKAYIILAHAYPALLERIIERMDDGNSVFFIHLDKKSDQQTFTNLHRFDDKVRFVPNVTAAWGMPSLVHATLNALRAIQNAGEFERILLLSGQDYPLKTGFQLDEFFRDQKHSIFIEYFRLPDHKKWQTNGGLYRVNKYFMGLGLKQRLFAKFLNGASRVFPYLERKMPAGLQPYAGSQWWIIDQYAMNFILDYVEQNPDYLKFHEHTFASDEVFFHMILLNAKDEKLNGSIVNDNKRFIKWKNQSSSHPEVVEENDLSDIMQSDALFVRKVHPTQSEKLMDLIDKVSL